MKHFFIIFFLALGVFVLARPVEAHFLASDGSIGVVLHVDPNDAPVAGSQASFFFEFKDKQNKFKPEDCDCTFEIEENGKNIFSQPLFQNAEKPTLTNASVFFTFPHLAVYKVRVVGKPINPNEFQPFTLSWDFRVDQQAQTLTPKGDRQGFSTFIATHVIHIISLVALCIGFLIYIITNKQKRKPQIKKGGEKKDDKKDSDTQY